MVLNVLRDDGYRAPRLVALAVVAALLVAFGYLFLASRGVAQAQGDDSLFQSSHVRKVDEAVEDARTAMSGKTPRRWRTR